MRNLRVASFNIRNGRAWDGMRSWPLRRRAVLETVRELDADVLGLQEAYRFQWSWLVRRLGDVGAHGAGRNDGVSGEWCPVLHRRDRLQPVAAWDRWFGEHSDSPGSMLMGATFPRMASAVRYLDRDAGVTFEVINTHLDERSLANRKFAASQLAAWIDPEVPTVLVGDLNASPDETATFERLRLVGLRDALPPDAPGTAHEWRADTTGPRLDHVLVSDHFAVEEAGVAVTTDPPSSDHWPVWATLSLRG